MTSSRDWHEVYCAQFDAHNDPQRGKVNRFRTAYLNLRTGSICFSGQRFHVNDWVIRDRRTGKQRHFEYYNAVLNCVRPFRWKSPGSNNTQIWIAKHDIATGQAVYVQQKSNKRVTTRNHANDFRFEEVDAFGQHDELSWLPWQSLRCSDGVDGYGPHYFLRNSALDVSFQLGRFNPKRLYGGAKLPAGVVLLEVKRTLFNKLPYTHTPAWPLSPTLQSPPQVTTSALSSRGTAKVSTPLKEQEEKYMAFDAELIANTLVRSSQSRRNSKAAPSSPEPRGIVGTSPKTKVIAEVVLEIATDRGVCWRRVLSARHNRPYYVQYFKSGTTSVGEGGPISTRSVWKLPLCPSGYRPMIDRTTGIVSWVRSKLAATESALKSSTTDDTGNGAVVSPPVHGPEQVFDPSEIPATQDSGLEKKKMVKEVPPTPRTS